MIAYIRGQLVEKSPTRAVIEAAGVGYEFTIPISTYDRLPPTGTETKLLAVHCVREDDETLYGFADEDGKTMFMKLISVSGVGPKIAISILSGCSIGELAISIANGDSKRISSIKGVGKKTAEKICIELRDKVDTLSARGLGSEKGDNGFIRDAILALNALGFNEETATKMIAKIIDSNSDVSDTETLIRLALSSR